MKEMSLEKVEKILKSLEDKGLVFKTWDVKKNDYVWHQTGLGRKLVENTEWKEGME